jgi:hypothetical protein
MRPYRARFREQGIFFAFQSWAGCITNIFRFDLQQAQVGAGASTVRSKPEMPTGGRSMRLDQIGR